MIKTDLKMDQKPPDESTDTSRGDPEWIRRSHCEAQQTLLENLNDVPFIPECEVFFEDGVSSKQLLLNCEKNPGHPTFIPVNEFTIQSLPQECQTAYVVDYVRRMCDRTVKITVSCCSLNRPEKYPNTTAPYPYNAFRGSHRVVRCGTGFIENTLPNVTKGKCPCHVCERSEQPKNQYLVVQVSTAAHVIFDGVEAKNVSCELFYDSDDDLKGVKHLYGVKEWDFKEYCDCGSCNNDDAVDADKDRIEKCAYDSVIITCVTHELDLIERLQGIIQSVPPKLACFPLELIVSHPHGSSKQISLGKTLKHILPLPIGHFNDDQFTIGRQTKCQLAKNATVVSKALFEQFSSCYGIPFYEGRVLTISETMKVLLPPNAQYIYQVDRMRAGSHSYFTRWVQFPIGTKFIYGDGENENDSFALPDVEFQLSYLDRVLGSEAIMPFYVTYDIDTCPGCSGAPIMIMDKEGPYFKCHSGALRDGTNRSEVS